MGHLANIGGVKVGYKVYRYTTLLVHRRAPGKALK